MPLIILIIQNQFNTWFHIFKCNFHTVKTDLNYLKACLRTLDKTKVILTQGASHESGFETVKLTFVISLIIQNQFDIWFYTFKHDFHTIKINS